MSRFLILLPLLLGGCNQYITDSSLVGTWIASLITGSIYNPDSGKLTTCETMDLKVTLNKDNTFTFVTTSTEVAHDDCFQDELYKEVSTTTGTWSTWTADEDGGTFVHSRSDTTTLVITDDTDTTTWKDNQTFEDDTLVGTGRDDMGKFMIWDGTLLRPE
ncbi:MAG: hypothetical protein HN348_11435 [Proteobacteria bacterium]|jgi:hypothetical protein|nr:hypothetical protein [Pseudomonadota bacterium]